MISAFGAPAEASLYLQSKNARATTFETVTKARLHSMTMQVLQTNCTKPPKHFLGDKTEQEISPDRNRTKYKYDGFGQRVVKTTNPWLPTEYSRAFLYGQNGELLWESQWTSSGIRVDVAYIWLNGVPIAMVRTRYGSGGGLWDEVLTNLHPDHLGTPRIGTKSGSQTISWRWQPDAFGKGPDEADPDGDGNGVYVMLRFPGQYYDGPIAKYYNHFRTYDPTTGRYLESDPIGLDGGLNTYAYVGNMPVTYVDPFGLDRLPPSYPVSHPDYYHGPRGDFYDTTGRQRPEPGRGRTEFYAEYGGCIGIWCIMSQTNEGTSVLERSAIPEIGSGISLCAEVVPSDDSCSISDADTNFLDFDDYSVGMGRFFGMTANSRKLCINLGIGYGSPLSGSKREAELPPVY